MFSFEIPMFITQISSPAWAWMSTVWVDCSHSAAAPTIFATTVPWWTIAPLKSIPDCCWWRSVTEISYIPFLGTIKIPCWGWNPFPKLSETFSKRMFWFLPMLICDAIFGGLKSNHHLWCCTSVDPCVKSNNIIILQLKVPFRWKLLAGICYLSSESRFNVYTYNL